MGRLRRVRWCLLGCLIAGLVFLSWAQSFTLDSAGGVSNSLKQLHL